MSIKKKSIGVAAAAAFVLTACGDSGTEGTAGTGGGDTVTFHAVTNLSGTAVIQGIPIQAMKAYLAREDAPAPRIDIVEKDSLTDPAKTTELLRNAADDEAVLGVVGLGLSSQMEAAIPLLDRLQIPAISTPSVSTRESGYYFRAAAYYPTSGTATAAFVNEKYPGANIAIIGPDTPAVHTSTDVFVKDVEAAGANIVYNDYFAPDAAGTQTETRAAIAAKPDIIMVNSLYNASWASSFFAEMELRGQDIPTVWLSNGCSSNVLEQATGPMYSICAALPMTVSGVEETESMKAVLESSGASSLLDSDDDSFAVQGIEVAKVLEAAVQECGGSECTRESLLEALKAVDLPSDGMAGALSFDNPDKNALSEMAVIFRDADTGTVTVESDFKRYDG